MHAPFVTAGSHNNRAVVQERLELLDGKRLRVIEALDIVAARRPQELQLEQRLDALGHRDHAEILGDADDAEQDGRAAGRRFHIGEEAHIQLQDVHRDVLQHVQRGIPAAEIVHHDLESRASQLVGRLDELIGVVHVSGLRNLQPQQGRRQLVFFQQRQQFVGQIRLEQIDAGDVHRDGNVRQPPLLPVRKVTAGHLPHVMVEIRDEPVVLEQGNEIPRLDQPLRRVDPPHEGFGADRLLKIQAVDRLQVEHERLTVERRLHVVEDLLLGNDRGPHVFIEVHIAFVVVALDGSARHVGAVAHDGNVHRRIGDWIDAVMDDKVVGKAQIVGKEPLALQQGLQVEVLFPHAEGEHVGAEPPADALPQRFPEERRSDLDQDAVAHPGAVNVVDDLEPVHVAGHQYAFLPGVLVQEATHRVKESVLRRNAGQPVQTIVAHFGGRARRRLWSLLIHNQAHHRAIAFLPEILSETGQR